VFSPDRTNDGTVNSVRIVLAVLIALLAVPARADDTTQRADVQTMSNIVMPFSMDATRHVCTPTGDGGTQSVVVSGSDPPRDDDAAEP
jgi:hypothetical protein